MPIPPAATVQAIGHQEVANPVLQESFSFYREILGADKYQRYVDETDNSYLEHEKAAGIKLEPPQLQDETRRLHTVICSICTIIKSLGTQIGINIAESEQLTHELEAKLSYYDQMVKSFQTWKNYLKWSAAIILVGTFIIQMGWAGAIPKFVVIY